MRKSMFVIGVAFAWLFATVQAWANAGRVDFAVGNVTAQQPAAQPRPLVKGADVLSGDKIVVGDGRAQIRFNDGAYVSLLPNTEFHIRDYRYSGQTDGTERSFMSLLRGTVRAVSGLVGRVNKAAYQIETPTATLGIRGTAGIIEVAADGTTKITTTSGIWTMNNRAGSVDVPAGQAAVSTPNQSQPPQRTAPTAAAAPPAAGEKPRQQVARNGETRDDQQFQGAAAQGGRETDRQSLPGNQPLAGLQPPALAPKAPIAPPAATTYVMVGTSATLNTNGLSNLAAGDAFVHNLGATPTSVGGSDGPSGFNSRGGTPSVANPLPGVTDPFTGTTSAASGSLAQWAKSPDGTLGWGRWEGAGLKFNGLTAGAALQDSVHFIKALPSLSIPTTGSATFNLTGGTLPTNSLGYATAPLAPTLGSNLFFDFANPSNSRVTLIVQSQLDAASGTQWNIQVGGPTTGAIDLRPGPGGQNSLFGTFAGPITNNAATCASGCGSATMLSSTTFTSNVAGVITGERPGGGGTQAGFAYRINVSGPGSINRSPTTFPVPGQSISGVAVFAR